ncbi:GNAT family N-acetyltransferase [Erwinia psidii]|uniref:GNAT family N-acetyltransferase n=1 Tax=Erwinia psidii TaxID=69224 RepID=A0A3N6S968_9GAMM|nr:GNAT family N-acetyltransferase [Erwinia psidii]MCX8958831.1 GNAT family N-acetyltransferase [Erwinia psidii]MCX8961902.1 GNAT family N-acetyltransferase [Erwinia psidii]MCX8966166.1 GNAT family N-acetyltransferase [Erwinia psidii]RQM37760.1 GNAT family N-acetyltransferase [Erwinia psidii]
MSEIVIRHAAPEDAADLHRILNQPETYADTLQIPHSSLSLIHTRLADQQPGKHRLVACIDGVVVGDLALEVNSRARRRHTASFGICVDSNHRQRGVANALMQEMVGLCDNWLNVTRIELTVFADNQPAIRLYQRFGFASEGLARRHAMRDGKLVDTLYMARLKE